MGVGQCTRIHPVPRLYVLDKILIDSKATVSAIHPTQSCSATAPVIDLEKFMHRCSAFGVHHAGSSNIAKSNQRSVDGNLSIGAVQLDLTELPGNESGSTGTGGSLHGINGHLAVYYQFCPISYG